MATIRLIVLSKYRLFTVGKTVPSWNRSAAACAALSPAWSPESPNSKHASTHRRFSSDPATHAATSDASPNAPHLVSSSTVSTLAKASSENHSARFTPGACLPSRYINERAYASSDVRASPPPASMRSSRLTPYVSATRSSVRGSNRVVPVTRLWIDPTADSADSADSAASASRMRRTPGDRSFASANRSRTLASSIMGKSCRSRMCAVTRGTHSMMRCAIGSTAAVLRPGWFARMAMASAAKDGTCTSGAARMSRHRSRIWWNFRPSRSSARSRSTASAGVPLVASTSSSCVIAAVPPAGVAASEVAPGAGARAFGPRGRLGSDSSMPASPPARAPSPRPAGAPISRPDAATVNARRWGTLGAGAGGARGDGTEDEEGATRRAGEASFRGDPSVPRRKSVAAPTRWIERIKPRATRRPGEVPSFEPAQLCKSRETEEGLAEAAAGCWSATACRSA